MAYIPALFYSGKLIFCPLSFVFPSLILPYGFPVILADCSSSLLTESSKYKR
jgi:hypothetical protein